MPKLAMDIWADGPSGAPYNPPKHDIRAWGTFVESFTNSAGSSGLPVFVSKSQMDSELGYAQYTLAWVIDDADVNKIGVYQKAGGPGIGSWSYLRPLPYSFMRADITGGDGNAIQASTVYPVVANVLVALIVDQENTTSPVTVSFNGRTAVPIKTSSGNDIIEGGLKPPLALLGFLNNGAFRLVTDQISSSIVAAAEAAAVRAEEARDEAIGANPNVFALTRSVLKALDPASVQSVYLKENGREGQFVWLSGDYSARISADPREGIFIKAGSIPSNQGAWVRIFAPRSSYSVDWWGTARDGSTDDAPAFNAARALVSTIGGGWIDAGPFTYFLASTIVGASGVFWRGADGLQTTLYRTGSYGHTFTQTGGYGKIKGFHFSHSFIPNPGATSLANRLTDNTGHIRLDQTQNFEVSGNRLSRMPYGILHDGAVNTHIDYNWFIGWWDAQNAAGQEGIADISFIGSSAHGQLCKITRNYFSGAYNGKRNHTFSNGGNTVVAEIGYNTGRKNAIFAASIEDLDIDNNYFGRNAESLIRFAQTGGANDILIDIRVRGNLFDNGGNGFHHISTESLAAGKYMLGLNIVGNTFNGEFDTISALLCTAAPGNGPSVVNLSMLGNNIFGMVGCPIVLLGSKNGVVSANSIQSYNCLSVGLFVSGTSEYKAGVYVSGQSDNNLIANNIIGGGGNEASATATNFCYEGVKIVSSSGKYNWQKNNVLSLMDGNNNPRRGLSDGSTRVITTGGGTTAEDHRVLVANSTGSAVSVSLPAYPVLGQAITIKDAGGNASSLNIQVIPGAGVTQIDGGSSSVINANFASRTFVYNGTTWSVL